MKTLKATGMLKYLLLINLWVPSEMCLAGEFDGNLGELRSAARDLQVNREEPSLQVVRNESGVWVKEPGKPGHLLGDENTNFGSDAYDNSPFIVIKIEDGEVVEDLESSFADNDTSLVFPILHEELLKLSLGEVSSAQLERILSNRFLESRRLSFEEHGAMYGSVTETGVKAVVKKVVEEIVGKLTGGGVVDLVWPSKLGDDDDKPLREYIENPESIYPVLNEHL